MLRDRSTKTFGGFVFSCAVNALVALVWYRNLLFRALPGLTFDQSKLVFLGLLAGSVLVDVFVLFRRRRTEWTALVCVLLPCGVYSLLSCGHLLGSLPAAALGAAGVLTAINAAQVLAKKIRSHDRGLVIKNRLYHCLCAAHSFFAAAMAAILIVLISRALFGTVIAEPSVEAAAGTSFPPQTIEENMDTLLLLQPQEWEQLSIEKRLDVMQTVANIEAQYLGLPNELNVGAANLPENTLGEYDDRVRVIRLNLDLLEDGAVEEVLLSCCHEVYHGYQYRLVDAYRGAGEELRGLKLFRDAARYSREFSDYENGETAENFYEYYMQACESDARRYAEGTAADYYLKIADYLEETGAN